MYMNLIIALTFLTGDRRQRRAVTCDVCGEKKTATCTPGFKIVIQLKNHRHPLNILKRGTIGQCVLAGQ